MFLSELPPGFVPPEPDGEYDEQLMANIAAHGWHFVHVAAEENSPPFVFTIGLFEKRNHPEIILMGLPPQAAHGILNVLMVKIFGGGERMEPFARHDDVTETFPITFVPVAFEHYEEYLGYANWYYGSLPGPYPALQLVWPDKSGKFPWEPGYEEAFHALQPILGHMPH
jgi:hypothetical protein